MALQNQQQQVSPINHSKQQQQQPQQRQQPHQHFRFQGIKSGLKYSQNYSAFTKVIKHSQSLLLKSEFDGDGNQQQEESKLIDGKNGFQNNQGVSASGGGAGDYFNISENILKMLDSDEGENDDNKTSSSSQQQPLQPNPLKSQHQWQQQLPYTTLHHSQQQNSMYNISNSSGVGSLTGIRPQRSEANKLLRLTKKLVETLQKCNPTFVYQPLLNPKRELTQPSEGVQNNGFDNLECDYILRVGDYITTPEGRDYEILDLMGRGTFGQVVKCSCKQNKEMVAVKIIKNKKAFKNQGVIEIKMLDILNRIYDPNGETPIVRMLDFFVFRNHLCIVFELLSASLFDLLKETQFNGVSLNFSRLIISKILEGMKVLKDARLIHCDLKPENILFKTKENLNLKIIDVGSACFEGHGIFQYIQSRYYRSPEVIIGLQYDSSIDMWSLGCICAELFLGIPIFPGNSEYDQLSKIIEILGIPPLHMISKAKFRDKYFVFVPETQSYRFKTFEEFQITTGVRLEIPRKYTNLTCLDDLKTRFIQKKTLEQMNQAAKEGRQINLQTFQPRITESEINTIDSFIDFLKGVLRLDKDTRWTPNMAMTHPFITRNVFTGPFEPSREVDGRSTTETFDESMSERSPSSRDSRDYKAGSCPSKILYPQTASVPQYLQHQNANFQPILMPSQNRQQNPALNNPGGGFNSSGGMMSSSMNNSEYVFHGIDTNIQSHRPPILSIPDEYFKGFMFNRLDQILSMTKDQLVQFVWEQNEINFKQQQAHKLMIMQQQQYLFQQQQQQLMNQQAYHQMMLQQQQQQLLLQQNPQSIFSTSQQTQQPLNQFGPPQIQGVPNIDLSQSQINLTGPQTMIGGMPLPLQQQQQQQQQFLQMNPGMQLGGQLGGLGMMPGGGMIGMPGGGLGMGISGGMSGGLGGGYSQQIMLPSQNALPRGIFPNEQIIFNPPPYQIQKSQLTNADAQNDPNFMITQQQRMMALKNQRAGNQGKPGSWQPTQGIQQQKYNQYFNQINNPGQLIGRQTDYQLPAQLNRTAAHNQNQPSHHHSQQQQQQQQFKQGDSMKVGSLSTSTDFKKLRERKNQKFVSKVSNDQIASSVIIEEPDKNSNSDKGGQQTSEVPFPSNIKNFLPTAITQDHQNSQQQEKYFPLFQDNFQPQYHHYQPMQMTEQQAKMLNQVQSVSSFTHKQNPSPKIMSHSSSFLASQKNQAIHSRNQSINTNTSAGGTDQNPSNNANLSQSKQTTAHGEKGFLKKFESQSQLNQSFNSLAASGIGGGTNQDPLQQQQQQPLQKTFINTNHYHQHHHNRFQPTSGASGIGNVVDQSFTQQQNPNHHHKPSLSQTLNNALQDASVSSNQQSTSSLNSSSYRQRAHSDQLITDESESQPLDFKPNEELFHSTANQSLVEQTQQQQQQHSHELNSQHSHNEILNSSRTRKSIPFDNLKEQILKQSHQQQSFQFISQQQLPPLSTKGAQGPISFRFDNSSNNPMISQGLGGLQSFNDGGIIAGTNNNSGLGIGIGGSGGNIGFMIQQNQNSSLQAFAPIGGFKKQGSGIGCNNTGLPQLIGQPGGGDGFAMKPPIYQQNAKSSSSSISGFSLFGSSQIPNILAQGSNQSQESDLFLQQQRQQQQQQHQNQMNMLNQNQILHHQQIMQIQHSLQQNMQQQMLHQHDPQMLQQLKLQHFQQYQQMMMLGQNLQLQQQQQKMLMEHQQQMPIIRHQVGGSFKKGEDSSSSFKKLTPIDEDNLNEKQNQQEQLYHQQQKQQEEQHLHANEPNNFNRSQDASESNSQQKQQREQQTQSLHHSDDEDSFIKYEENSSCCSKLQEDEDEQHQEDQNMSSQFALQQPLCDANIIQHQTANQYQQQQQQHQQFQDQMNNSMAYHHQQMRGEQPPQPSTQQLMFMSQGMLPQTQHDMVLIQQQQRQQQMQFINQQQQQHHFMQQQQQQQQQQQSQQMQQQHQQNNHQMDPNNSNSLFMRDDFFSQSDQ